MKTLSITLAIFAILVGVSCSESETGPITTAQQNAQNDAQRLLLAQPVPDIQGTQTVYYREDLFKINVKRTTKASVIESGQPISKLFYIPNYPFSMVLNDATDRRLTQYSLLYLIKFSEMVRPRQFRSMAEIDDAVAAKEITLEMTELFYSFDFIR